MYCNVRIADDVQPITSESVEPKHLTRDVASGGPLFFCCGRFRGILAALISGPIVLHTLGLPLTPAPNRILEPSLPISLEMLMLPFAPSTPFPPLNLLHKSPPTPLRGSPVAPGARRFGWGSQKQTQSVPRASCPQKPGVVRTPCACLEPEGARQHTQKCARSATGGFEVSFSGTLTGMFRKLRASEWQRSASGGCLKPQCPWATLGGLIDVCGRRAFAIVVLARPGRGPEDNCVLGYCRAACPAVAARRPERLPFHRPTNERLTSGLWLGRA